MSITSANAPITDLEAGDLLLAIGDIALSPAHQDRHTVVTCTPIVGDSMAQICTSHTDYMVTADITVTFTRPEQTPTLLISRRRTLHTEVLGLGIPMNRRTPVSDDDTATAVTPEEWNAASMILIDGHLARNTILDMWAREEFSPEGKQILMVGTDLDDPRIWVRGNAAAATGIVFLPDAGAQLTRWLTALLRDQPLDL